MVTLAGGSDARFDPGEIVTGKYADTCIHALADDRFREAPGNFPGGLVEEFANWPDTLPRILEFTKRYGALTQRAEEGKTFSFGVEEWRACQHALRQEWTRISRQFVGLLRTGKRETGSPLIDFENGERIHEASNSLCLVTSTLDRLLRLELYLVPASRLRICRRRDCEHPYFIARHQRRQYCSADCSNWAQRKCKRNWWNDYSGARKLYASGLSAKETAEEFGTDVKTVRRWLSQTAGKRHRRGHR